MPTIKPPCCEEWLTRAVRCNHDFGHTIFSMCVKEYEGSSSSAAASTVKTRTRKVKPKWDIFELGLAWFRGLLTDPKERRLPYCSSTLKKDLCIWFSRERVYLLCWTCELESCARVTLEEYVKHTGVIYTRALYTHGRHLCPGVSHI